jgi:GNAT superfamily N-acetyltransferase
VQIESLDADQMLVEIDALSEVLLVCVEGGASVGFMQPFSLEDARVFWSSLAQPIADQKSWLFVARVGEEIVGTVRLDLAGWPNQTHRADVMKLLVHTKARGRGIGRALMEALERKALKMGRSVLVLDTATGSDAEKIYEKIGWKHVGVIPNFARYPNGALCSTTLMHKQIGPLPFK